MEVCTRIWKLAMKLRSIAVSNFNDRPLGALEIDKEYPFVYSVGALLTLVMARVSSVFIHGALLARLQNR